ncbi:hypothetical protein K3H38_01310 [Aeromonas veronii]|uniref:hypothetical protein n=1 Tax=Aeromonas veronii TaxID=654 RepID=UPI001F3A610F|nr:hypothetical protein [Aeromonas veronii]MCF5881610.1 hypothetical protein [Aeromonas veronii]
MQNKNVYKISNKFYQVLLKMTGLKISRKELIRLAMEVNDLAVYQASGLVDRHVYSLKKQDAVKANGPKNNRHYIFSDDLLGSLQASIKGDNYDLASELRSLEEELLLTRYELQAYREILEKLPQEKQKITCLHKNASEKIYRLNGKIRAVSQREFR